MQAILRRDGYVNNDTEDAEETEELLAPLDSPLHSHTIPELASMSQVLAPNSIDAELHSVSLHSPHSRDATRLSALRPGIGACDDHENSDPNQMSAMRSHDSQHLELQPLGKKKQSGVSSQHEASMLVMILAVLVYPTCIVWPFLQGHCAHLQQWSFRLHPACVHQFSIHLMS